MRWIKSSISKYMYMIKELNIIRSRFTGTCKSECKLYLKPIMTFLSFLKTLYFYILILLWSKGGKSVNSVIAELALKHNIRICQSIPKSLEISST